MMTKGYIEQEEKFIPINLLKKILENGSENMITLSNTCTFIRLKMLRSLIFNSRQIYTCLCRQSNQVSALKPITFRKFTHVYFIDNIQPIQ